MRREPSHLLVQPNQQRPALAQRRSVAGPVRRSVTGGEWFAHAPRLTAWIHNVNPRRSELCNNAKVIHPEGPLILRKLAEHREALGL